jgi:hypothetical protein
LLHNAELFYEEYLLDLQAVEQEQYAKWARVSITNR